MAVGASFVAIAVMRQGVGNEVQEGVTKKTTGCESQEDLQKILVGIQIGNEEEEDEGSKTNAGHGANGIHPHLLSINFLLFRASSLLQGRSVAVIVMEMVIVVVMATVAVGMLMSKNMKMA